MWRAQGRRRALTGLVATLELNDGRVTHGLAEAVARRDDRVVAQVRAAQLVKGHDGACCRRLRRLHGAVVGLLAYSGRPEAGRQRRGELLATCGASFNKTPQRALLNLF